MADGASYDAEGTMLSRCAKIFTLPHVPCALASRGLSALVPSLMMSAYRAPGFDELVLAVPDILRVTVEGARAINPTPDFAFQLLVAGWSARSDRPELHFISDHGERPWEMLSGQSLALMPLDHSVAGSMIEAGLEPGLPDFDPEREGVELAERQREHAVLQQPGGGTTRHIGAHLELVSVRRDRITSRILKRWPDRIGEKVASIPPPLAA